MKKMCIRDSSCSNGPIVSPLVWLHEIYKGKSDEVTYGYVAADNLSLIHI